MITTGNFGVYGLMMKMFFAQSCPTLCDTMDYNLPGSSVQGILHVRILEWVAIPFSRGSSQPRDQTQVSCIAGRFFTIWATREALFMAYLSPIKSVGPQLNQDSGVGSHALIFFPFCIYLFFLFLNLFIFLIFEFIYFLTEGQLLYRTVLDSAKNQHESAIGIHMSPPSWTSLPIPPF